MTLTPSIMIATKGLLSGQSIAISPVMTTLFNKVNLHPLIAPTTAIQASAYSASLNNLETFIATTNAATIQVLNRAQNIFPGGVNGTKIFISLFNSALSFCSTSLTYYSAIQEFGSKNFSDFGIKNNSFRSITSNNLSGLFPNLKTSESVKQALTLLSEDLGNFGSAYDFTDLFSFGPQNLLQSLYNQNLTSKSGINDAIREQGYDPNNIAAIPDQISINILSAVTNSELEHILKMLSVRSTKTVLKLSDLLNLSFLMRAETISTLNIKQNDLSIKDLGNSLLNLGVTLDLETLRNLLASAELKDYQYLDKLAFPLPEDISNSLKISLGNGSGMYQNPTLNDLIGTVAGETHILAFKKVLNALNYFTYNTTYGENLSTALQRLNNAIIINDAGQIASAQSNLTSAITAFNSAVLNNNQAQSYILSANQALADSANQLIKELNNMLNINIDLSVVQSANPSVLPILNFGQNLHTYGQDINQLGTAKLLDACSSTNIYGDALNASIIEGRNISRSQYVAKNTSAIANQSTTDKVQASSFLATLDDQQAEIKIIARDNSAEALFLDYQISQEIKATKRIIESDPLI